VNVRALHAKQRLDALGHVEQAIAEVRACIETAVSCGPLLVACYRALSTLGELREVVDELPLIEKEEK